MNNSTEIKKSLLWYAKAESRSCSIPSENDNLSVIILYVELLDSGTFTFNWSYNNMKSFLKELSNQERTFYQKVYLVTGINHDPKNISAK
jgi:hypothetical protein